MNDGGFDAWAETYEQSVFKSSSAQTYPFAGYEAVLDGVYAAACGMPEGPVLDIGMGTGTLTRRFYDAGREVVGVDFSRAMIDKAREAMPDATLVRANFARGLPEAVTARRYGAIVSTYALHHLPDTEKVALLKALYALLLPGGVLAVGDIAFATRQDMEQARARQLDEWDDDEHYFVWEAFRSDISVPARYMQVSSCAGVLTLAKPRMVLLDYGGTIAQERDFDPLAANAALLAVATQNPRGVTAEAYTAHVQPLFWALDDVRLGHQVEVHEHAFLRYTNAYFGLEYDIPPVEQELLLWTAGATPALTEGMAELLTSLRAQGIQTGVISNIMYSGEALRRRLDMLLPEHAFAFVLATSEYIYRKPDVRIFALALRMANLPARDVWYLGDNPVCDVQGARGAGMTPIWYTKEAVDDVLCIPDWRRLTAWMGCTTIENPSDTSGRTT